MRLAQASAAKLPRRPLWLALAAVALLAPVLLLLIIPRLTAARPRSSWPGVWSRVADLPGQPGPLILLKTGKVLLANFVNGPSIYDPATNTWSSAKAWGQVANFGQFTPLNDGRLLVTSTNLTTQLPIAGIYNPRSDSWTNVKPMPHNRYLFSSITLRDGRVLFIGGQQSTYTGTPALQTDVYDPASNSWTVTGSIAAPRTNPIVLLLHDGRVMMLGGLSPNPSCAYWCGTASVELFDPKAGTWSSGASLPKALFDFPAVLLPSGKVLVVGGADALVNQNGPRDAYLAYADAELYDPTSNTWSAAAPMSSARLGQSATLLPTGRVLVAGGQSGANYWTSAEVYDPARNAWQPTASMPHHHVEGYAVALSDGQVFVSSGALGPGECFGSLPGGAIAAVARVPRISQVPLGPALPGCGGWIHEEDMYSTHVDHAIG